jgi:hypothetical protein
MMAISGREIGDKARRHAEAGMSGSDRYALSATEPCGNGNTESPHKRHIRRHAEKTRATTRTAK